MLVGKSNLQALFAKQVWYEIPPFQRQYVWDEDVQWEPLWADVRDTAERYIESQATASQAHSRTHFMGAVVLQQKQTPSSEQLESRLVVDGQQRLTTLQLLADAIQEIFEEQGLGAASRRLSNIVLNNEDYWGGNPDRKFKVWPTIMDQEAFRYAMSNELPNEEYGEANIVRAHVFFKSQVENWLTQSDEGMESRATALESVIRNHLELVVIDLEREDDPHIIFETLNARGTPLLQADLVKNMVMYEAGNAGISLGSEEAQKLWPFSDSWWLTEVPQGRLVRPRIDMLLNFWISIQRRKEVSAVDVFSTFRRYYDKRRSHESIMALVHRIRIAAGHYRQMELGTQPGMEKFLYRRGVMQLGVTTPVLLSLLNSETPQPQLGNALIALESYLVRRMILRMATSDYNRLFIGLIAALEESDPKNADATLIEYLGTQTAPARIWPDDHQMEAAFTGLPLFKLLTRGRLRIVLEGIEEELRTNMAETQSVPRSLTIEHIMPQQWRENWPLQSQVEDVEKSERDRDNLIHSIGNLTLVNQRLNSRLSNAPWEEKQAALWDHSVLFLNKTLLDNAPDVWDEDAIQERAIRMCQAAARVWPYKNKF